MSDVSPLALFSRATVIGATLIWPARIIACCAVFAGGAAAYAQERVPHLILQGETRLPNSGNAYRRPKIDLRLPQGRVVTGKRNVAAAWFSHPTDVYRHDPFNTGVHARTLTVSTSGRRILRLRLPKNSVFEDLVPRLADINGDGNDEILVVRSHIHKGAALSVVRVLSNGLLVMAETPPIGTPFRWLNPAGVGDFNGDGKADIAIVVTPHLGGVLQFWTLRNDKLEMIASERDVANHVNGSTKLGLAAVADFNRDGIADLAVPDQSRRVLRFLTLRNGRVHELGRKWLAAAAQSDFKVIDNRGSLAVRVGIAGDRGILVTPCRDIPGWQMERGQC